MNVDIKALKVNLHTKIGELNPKKIEVIKDIVFSRDICDFNEFKQGPNNILIFINNDKRQALLISDSQIHFSFDFYNAGRLAKYIEMIKSYGSIIFEKLLLQDEFKLAMEIVGQIKSHDKAKYAALNQSINNFTSASSATLKENLGSIKLYRLR